MSNESKEAVGSPTSVGKYLESSGARHFLRLGHLLFMDLQAPELWSTTGTPMTSTERAAATAAALETVKQFLVVHSGSKLVKAFGRARVSCIQDAELRMVSLCAYGQLLGEEGHATFQEVLHAGAEGDRRPEIQLEAKIGCSELIGRGVLRLGDDDDLPMHAPVYLGDDLAEHFVGGPRTTTAAKVIAKGGPEKSNKEIPAIKKRRDKENKKYGERISAAKEADGRIRFCAHYAATKGLTRKGDLDLELQLFSEFKIRLSRQGSWKNISHLLSELVARYGVPPERMG